MNSLRPNHLGGIEFKTKLSGHFRKYGRMKCRKICGGNNEKKAKSDKCAKCTNLFSKVVQLSNQWITNTFSDQHLFCVFSDQKSKQILQESTHLHYFFSLCFNRPQKCYFPLYSQKYCKVASSNTSCFRSTCRLFQIAYVGDFWCFKM